MTTPILYAALLLLLVPQFAAATRQDEFDAWKAVHGRVYPSATEEASRFHIFANWSDRIEQHNAEYERGLHTYYMAHNQFSDMTPEEFQQNVLDRRGWLLRSATAKKNQATEGTVGRKGGKVPTSLDWRTHGAVTPVKNQGQCGSCWAFSAVGAIEGVHQIATGHLVSFSEQQVGACCHTGPNGCNGGTMDAAFACVIKEGGIDPESAYPYIGGGGHLGECKINKTAEIKHVISGYKDVKQHTSSALQVAIAGRPVSAAVDATDEVWQMYAGGVLSGQCGAQLCHGVLVVGYTKDYWIVKNSWGVTWGEQGYIRLKRHDCSLSRGECGILVDASYPVV